MNTVFGSRIRFLCQGDL